MKNKFKKFTSALLALVMLCGVLAVAPVTVSATAIEYTTADDKGTYSFDPETGILHLKSGEFTGNAWQKHAYNNIMNWTVNQFAKKDVKIITAEKGVKFTGDCSRMFHSFYCTSIDLSNVNASEVTTMAQMFQACTKLESLDLSGEFNPSSYLYNMGNMLQGCSALTSVVFGEKYDTSGVQYFDNMFNGCSSLTSLDLHVFDTSNAKNMGLMFNGCSSLTTILNFTGKNAVNVTNMNKMFYGCSALTTLDISGLTTSSVTNMDYMFNGCSSLKSLDLSGGNIETGAQANLSYMFANCSSLTSLDLSSLNMSKVTSAGGMFSFDTQLREITISDKFTGGIKSNMLLNNGEDDNGWRISPSDYADRVSETGSLAVINQPSAKTTYKWIEYGTVTWNNWDNSLLRTEDYKLETIIHPTYKDGIPIKPDSNAKFYTFAGWTDGETEYDLNDELPIVTGNITYTAIFTESSTYTLNYIYQGRKGGNNGGYVGDDEATDEKTYTVTVELGDSDLKESGMPKDKVLVDNAPVVNDPYKNCRWTIDDEHVIFDPETKIVTITAEQPERKYSVVFKNSNNETTDVFRVKLNDFVKKNDSFITAEETDGSGTKFAYWSVVQNNKEVARCFERKFNLRVTGDSVVTANYGEAENLISLSDAEITRQPIYQNGIPKDCLYADFITAYMDKQGMELSKKSSSEYKTGLILQYNKEILVKENEPGATLNANDKITFGSDYELTAADAKTIADGETVSGKYSYKSISIDNSKYNDKNRLNKALPIENTELNRRMVYCAYYYVYNVKAGKIEMTAPVYFYLYDKGNEINTEN